ncbi:S8 family serine peptidase [Bacillus sp. CGMCC 1.16607]|uniref:S8 family serine peptidase n=1 Tax=Bacillus sp. CGMCC 1.16607 TaxID=3351842 RepID=UPI00362AA68C
MKKVSFLIIFMMLFFQNGVSSKQPLRHPPLPTESPHEEKVAIILLKNQIPKQEIINKLKLYRGLKLRYIFSEVLKGFSVKGPTEQIEKLRRQTEVLDISPIQTYKVESTESIKLIGGERIRGYYDQHNNRLTGKGVTVGVIDTGVDYSHPDLRRNYGGGHDLVDGDKDPMETTSAQGEPTLHGTHVAGVIAANGKMKGVAPEAKIIAYRALGPGGSGTTEQVLAAIEQAVKDKVDIVNLSLGNNVNGPDLPISLALNKLTEKGIVAVTSSGNSGPNKWTVGSPGTAAKAISVGASTPILKVPYILIEGTRGKIKLEPMIGGDKWIKDRSQEMALGGIGLKVQLKNVKGKIVLIKRGKITFTEKAINAVRAGAAGVIIYNNTSGDFIGNLQVDVGIPVASISKKAGNQIEQQIKRGQHHMKIIEEEEQDVLAAFSSRGPVTRTWEIKPDVLAPGVAIHSTVPGGYLSLQGTSMAAPHVAGACALIKQAHPDWSPEQIKAALMNSALPLEKSTNEWYRTFEQGAGRIQIEEAINSESIISPGSLQFGKFQVNDQHHSHRSRLKIENVSQKTVFYSFDVPKKIQGMTWHLPMSFSLQPGEKRSVDIQLEVDPTNFKEKIQDGYLKVNANSKKISLPFIYVLEEPDYPRVMGFEIGAGDKENTLRYQVYLPGGAEEFGIALFDPEDYRFISYLDWDRNVKKGMLEKELSLNQAPKQGVYLAKVFAKKSNKEDMVETMIEIGSGSKELTR